MGMSKFGFGLVTGKAPFCRILIFCDLEIAKTGELTKPFQLDPECLVDYRKLAVDWELAPDRIKRMFNQPTRPAKQKESKDV